MIRKNDKCTVVTADTGDCRDEMCGVIRDDQARIMKTYGFKMCWFQISFH